MPEDAVTEIKGRLDIVEVIGGYVTLKRSGHAHKGLCPFHSERTPSFTVSQDRQAWYCFGCQEGGDVFSFVEKIERCGFRQALEMLAERAGVELERSGPQDRGASRRRKRAQELNAFAAGFYEHVLWNTPAGEPGRRLLEDRGVSEELARRFGCGFAPAGGTGGDALVRYLVSRHGATLAELVDAGLAHSGRGGGRDRFRHRFLFPIREERGAVIAFGGRALGDAVPKYLNSPETSVYHKSTALFGLDLAREEVRRRHLVIVVEGYFDVLAFHRGGLANVVASSGTALSREQVRILRRHADSVALCFDGDEAGRTAASRAVDLCAAEGLPARIVRLPEDVKDPDELVRRDRDGLAAALEAARPEWEVLLDWAIGGAGHGVEERRLAAERAVAILVRIPEAATRDLYVQEAARRLELTPQALASDVSRAAAGGRRPQRLVVAPPSRAAETVPSEDAAAEPDPERRAEPAAPPPRHEEQIGAFAVQRPALAHVLVSGLGLQPSELTHPIVRHLLELALQVPAGLGFPLHSLAPGEQAVAARLLLRPVPEFDEDAGSERLERAMADSVRFVRLAALRRELAAERAARDAAVAQGDVEGQNRHGVAVSRLAAEMERLRGSPA